MGLFDVVGDIGKAVAWVVEELDPLPGMLEGACNMIGLPKEINGALEIFIGAVTDDVGSIVAGAGNLAGAVSQDLSCCAREAFDRPSASVAGYADSGSNAAGTGASSGASSTSASSSSSASSSASCGVHVGGAVGQADSSDTMGDQELKELQVLLNNFDAIDRRYLPADSIGVGGLRDGHIDMDDLQSLSDATGTPTEVKRAVRYLMDHPDVYAKLARTDGAITTSDLQIVMEDRRAELGSQTSTSGGGGGTTGTTPGIPDHTGGTPPGGTCGGTTGTGSTSTDDAQFASDLQSILADPNMSMEEKIERILMMIEQQIDKELGEKLRDLGDAQTKHLDAVKGGSSDEAEQTESKNNQETLQFEIQQLVERQKAMFDLMSNIESKFHDMANTAIQNLGRA